MKLLNAFLILNFTLLLAKYCLFCSFCFLYLMQGASILYFSRNYYLDSDLTSELQLLGSKLCDIENKKVKHAFDACKNLAKKKSFEN